MEQRKGALPLIDAIITKESGRNGGMEAKVKAAMNLGKKVFIVKAPVLPYDWIYVTEGDALRRAIETQLTLSQ